MHQAVVPIVGLHVSRLVVVLTGVEEISAEAVIVIASHDQFTPQPAPAADGKPPFPSSPEKIAQSIAAIAISLSLVIPTPAGIAHAGRM